MVLLPLDPSLANGFVRTVGRGGSPPSVQREDEQEKAVDIQERLRVVNIVVCRGRYLGGQAGQVVCRDGLVGRAQQNSNAVNAGSTMGIADVWFCLYAYPDLLASALLTSLPKVCPARVTGSPDGSFLYLRRQFVHVIDNNSRWNLRKAT